MYYKEFIPCFYLKDGRLVNNFNMSQPQEDDDLTQAVLKYSNAGADRFIVFDLSHTDAEHDKNLSVIRETIRITDANITAGGNVKRFEDIKKLLYVGCERALVDLEQKDIIKAAIEGSKRFGKEKIAGFIKFSEIYHNLSEDLISNVEELICLNISKDDDIRHIEKPVVLMANDEELIEELFDFDNIAGISGNVITKLMPQIYEEKVRLKSEGYNVNISESKVAWKDFKLNEDKMVPVIVQDYKTDEVLMLAYMNEESFNKTLRIGKMTYWSRSRKELWTKGDTSGHFQYVKELSIDCDKDTLLAKVAQVGAACHTGSRTCFYTSLLKKEYEDVNPYKVFENVYSVIADRKINKREGSYTNYLFDKGIDKILKKVGEEATEIIIAAKNPDPEEIKYEVSDFLYHVMVLMVERGVTWEDITSELSRR